jgi:hypothetical protein
MRANNERNMPAIVVAAIIGAIATLGAAVLNNWDKLFPPPQVDGLPTQRRASKRFRYAATLAVGVASLVTLIVVARVTREAGAPPPLLAPNIVAPQPGKLVGHETPVSGLSPFVLLDHYVVVTAVKTGVRYVVGSPFRTDAAGVFTSAARFGAGDVGVGETFSIEVVATNVALSEGVINVLPIGAKISRSVTVTRIR